MFLVFFEDVIFELPLVSEHVTGLDVQWFFLAHVN